MNNEEEFDGFWFLPTDEDDELNLAYFTFQEPYANGNKIGSIPIVIPPLGAGCFMPVFIIV